MTGDVLFLGDWYANDRVNAHAIVKGTPFIFNLEGPISIRGAPTPGKISLRMENNRIFECFGHKPAAVCLANNHIADYGNEALLDTFESLRAINVPFFGAGGPHNNFNNPAIIEVDSCRIALLGYVCSSTQPIYGTSEKLGVVPIAIDQIGKDIQLSRERGASRVVVMLHWGLQDTLLPRPIDVERAHEIISCGADLIIGHHAHSPQPVEDYRGRTIAYGLGNFIFPDLEVPVYSATLDKTPKRIYRQSQRYWNKVSWGFLWNPCNLDWETKQYYFDGEQVAPQKSLRPGSLDTNVNSALYPLRFRIHLSVHRFIWVAWDIVRDPTRLRPRHLLLAIRMLLRPERA